MALDEEIFQDKDFRFINVIDRLGVGGAVKTKGGLVYPGDIHYDGVSHPIRKKFRLRAPVARHCFGPNQRNWVHSIDEDGQSRYVHRLGILPIDEDDPDHDKDLIMELGPEFLDCTPIQIDQEFLEGWDAEAGDPNRKLLYATHLVNGIPVPRTDLIESENAGGRASFAGRG